MIINTGQRTDIPAFYSDWFVNRLKEGYVCVRNPYDFHQVSRYRLDPQVVDVIGFCTKNPAPMLRHMDLLAPFGQFWYVTITCYGRDIEPYVPERERVMDAFCELSEIVGEDAVGWRYDPIFVNEVYTVEYHIDAFAQMARRLRGHTKLCVFSFLDLYGKVMRNFPKARNVDLADRSRLGQELIHICKENGMQARPCHEGSEWEAYGADCSGCMTIPVYERAIKMRLHAPKKKGARDGCACYLSCDIGAYDTCGHLCRYCYANNHAALVRENQKAHDPHSPLLVGHLHPDDKIHDVVQKSWADGQMDISMFYT